MHIEPGIVEGGKIVLSYATATVSLGYAIKLAREVIRQDGFGAFALRTLMTSALTFAFFELLPHHPVGVSEVHLILGSTLLLLFGAAPAAFGLAAGLLLQGLLFAPADLPQLGMNLTTLLVPLFATAALAKRVIPARTAYVDISYAQALKLSLSFQGGIVAWVGFWAVYGQGFGAANLANVASFGAAYMTVILLEPLVDLGVLAGAKAWRALRRTPLVHARLHTAEQAG